MLSSVVRKVPEAERNVMTKLLVYGHIEKARICGYSNKFFMELKFSTRSVSVKMYAHKTEN